jgi:hypothetical protein
MHRPLGILTDDMLAVTVPHQTPAATPGEVGDFVAGISKGE